MLYGTPHVAMYVQTEALLAKPPSVTTTTKKHKIPTKCVSHSSPSAQRIFHRSPRLMHKKWVRSLCKAPDVHIHLMDTLQWKAFRGRFCDILFEYASHVGPPDTAQQGLGDPGRNWSQLVPALVFIWSGQHSYCSGVRRPQGITGTRTDCYRHTTWCRWLVWFALVCT